MSAAMSPSFHAESADDPWRRQENQHMPYAQPVTSHQNRDLTEAPSSPMRSSTDNAQNHRPNGSSNRYSRPSTGIHIPGFDPTKYGKPTIRKSTHDETVTPTKYALPATAHRTDVDSSTISQNVNCYADRSVNGSAGNRLQCLSQSANSLPSDHNPSGSPTNSHSVSNQPSFQNTIMPTLSDFQDQFSQIDNARNFTQGTTILPNPQLQNGFGRGRRNFGRRNRNAQRPVPRDAVQRQQTMTPTPQPISRELAPHLVKGEAAPKPETVEADQKAEDLQVAKTLVIGETALKDVTMNAEPGKKTSKAEPKQETTKSVPVPVSQELLQKPNNVQATQKQVTAKVAPERMQAAQPTTETKEEELQRLQDMQMAKIGRRNRHKGGMAETTSLRDLQLARIPVTFENPINANASANASTNASALSGPGCTDKRIPGGPIEQKSPDFSVPDWLAKVTVKNTGASVAIPEQHVDVTHDQLFETAPAENSVAVPQSKKVNNPRWATPEELKPIQMETNSNAYGSDVSSNASTADDDSIKAMHHRKLFRRNPPAQYEAPLTGWDGKWQPPPIDWNDRPRFNNNSPEYATGFNSWVTSVTPDHSLVADSGVNFATQPNVLVKNLGLHPDGLGFVGVYAGVNPSNAARKYGLSQEVLAIARNVVPLTPFDYEEDWGKLDLNYGDNSKIQDETTESLVRNWIAQKTRPRTPSVTTQAAEVKMNRPKPQPPHSHRSVFARPKMPEINPNTPKINIYLRPAVGTDVDQLTTLYNWYVHNSPRTSELEEVPCSEMRGRLDDCLSSKLPFLVAVNRQHKALHRVKGGTEKIVGFALATDFAGSTLAERISAELELYVDHEFLHQGVGRCLLDKLLESTDRGHNPKGGYTFTCDPHIKHHYNAGGGRDLNKLIFMIRHFKAPNTKVPAEADVDTWIKKWLVEKWQFEENGCITGVGTKFKRLTNITYLTKETQWLPIDGNVPEPLNTS